MTAVSVADAWSRYLVAGDAAAREQLILEHAPLVKLVAGRLAIYLPAAMDQEDVLAYGTLGLIQAVDRFEPSRGVKFETFASVRIRGAILDALRALRGLPQSVTDKARKLQEAALAFERDHGRAPSDDELASAMGVATSELNRTLQDAAAATVSLDNILERPADTRVRFLADGNRRADVAGTVEREEAVDELTSALLGLDERERLLLSLYYQDELTMREIGQVLDISEGRVCQLHARALHKLRVALARSRTEMADEC
jgi:RNA polymerase sigma factor for flagellar operon FliA